MDNISILESKLGAAESKLELERKQSEKRENELKLKFQKELNEKDEELAMSKSQISQLLRIIEQITQNNNAKTKGRSRVEGEKSPFW
jgi:thymidylate synthase